MKGQSIMKIKRLLSFSLAALLSLCALASCADEKADGTSSGSNDITDSAEEEQTEVIMPEYWGFNNYDRTEIKGAPDEIKSYPTTVKKESASKYSFTAETEAGKLTVTLEERPWGCFNLWTWKLDANDGKEHIFVPGSTDWEYVHIPITPNGSGVWSGGNHGNEAFLSLDIYDAESGEKLELEIGESATVNAVHVIEKTKLLWFPDDDHDSIGDYNNKSMTYTEDDVYAEMTRKYTFTGPQVKLNVDYKYVKDVEHNRSYTCMFPIQKKYGLWCEMYNNEGTLVNSIQTLKIGAADYSGKHYDKNVATRAVLYGYEDPRYQFDIRVTTFTDSLDGGKGDYKTSYWDMNTSSNKLYFTKFTNASKTLLKAGTEFHTESIWLFKFVSDATAPEIAEPEYESPDDITFEGENIALGKEYTLSGKLGGGYGSYTALLTDGKYTESLTYDSNWFSFFNNATLTPEELNTEDGLGYAVIDLGKETELQGVRAHICNGGTAGINAPFYGKIYLSSDGTNFTEAGEMAIASDPSAIYWAGLELDGQSARYVKFEFKPNGLFVFLNELEVYKA